MALAPRAVTGPLDRAITAAGALAAAWRGRLVVIGGIAIVARARPRLTEDLDLLIDVPEGCENELVATMRGVGMIIDDEVLAEMLPGGLVPAWVPDGIARDRAHGVGIDVLFGDDAFGRSVLARATPLDLGGAVLLVASPEDLLLMKLDANRPQDWDDALALKDAFGDRLDRIYLDAWAERLEVADRVSALLDRDE